MNNKKINKILNKLIIFLIILIIGVCSKEKFFSQKEEVKTNTIINDKLEIYYFDVGQADSILIKEKDKTILIDAGNNEDGENLVDYLMNTLKIDKIDILIGTHAHEDHIGGLDNIIDSLEIDKIYMPDAISTSKTYESVLESIENKEYKITIPKIDEQIALKDMILSFIYTGTDENNLNNSSIISRLIFNNTSYLFMGDAPTKIEKQILNKDIESDVIKIGHHGSDYSTSNELLDKVNPKYAIIEVGKDNIYNHPNKTIIEKLKKNNIKTYRTDIDGTIKLTSDGNKIEFETIQTKLDGE